MALITPPAALVKPATSPTPVAQGVKAGWLARGESSTTLAEVDEAQRQQRKDSYGKAFRYFLTEGQEARTTFVDGDLNEKGFLQPPRFYEHKLAINGDFNNYFVCPEKTLPGSGQKCPICESGDRPYLASLFTVIDHRQVESKKTPGKIHVDNVRLYVCKSITFEQLQKMATKVGGLAGSTWDISRSGEKSAAVGNSFFPQGKTDIAELQKKYMEEVKDPKSGTITHRTKFQPLDYDSEIVFRSGDELRKMGFGAPGTTVSSGFGQQQSKPAGGGYAEHL